MLIPRRPLGPALRRWRMLNRIKQSHAAEVLGVNQSTISRWEIGEQDMSSVQRARLVELLGARLTSAADLALRRLVQHHHGGAHLICDIDHRLLALSPSRQAEFGCDASELMGVSLYPFITEELARVEDALEEVGWYDIPCPPELIAETGANGSAMVPIVPGRCRLTRMLLSDGTAARLIETLPYQHEYHMR